MLTVKTVLIINPGLAVSPQSITKSLLHFHFPPSFSSFISFFLFFSLLLLFPKEPLNSLLLFVFLFLCLFLLIFCSA